MNNSSDIANLIRKIAKQKGFTIKNLLNDCELGRNFISQFANGQTASYTNLAKIAQYLNVSIDYLVGYTPQVDTQPLSNDLLSDEQKQELLRIYDKLDIRKKTALLTKAYELVDDA